jgi:YVTN family beta-propeller protein
VACEGDNRVDVLDTSERRRIASIKTKARPRAILFDRDGARAYVTTELGGAVEVMDARRHQLMTTIELRDASSPDRSSLRPMGLVLSPDEKLLYVTTGRAGSIAVIDTAQRKLSRMFTGIGARPWGIALHPDGSKLYTANGPSDDVSVIDPKSGALLKRVPTAKLPWGVALASVP